MNNRCKFWLPKKNRFCANARLNNSLFCGNHTSSFDGQWIPCPIDPSHSVLRENLEGHVRRCPRLKHVQSLTLQPFFHKGINGGNEEDEDGKETFRSSGIKGFVPSKMPPYGSLENITSETKRNAVHSMTAAEFSKLISKIESIHASQCKDFRESYKIPKACGIWINREVDGKLPFQEKHVLQQASILGNLEEFGMLSSRGDGIRVQDGCDVLSGDDINAPAVVEFGAGRGYLTQMLADCYEIRKAFLVERKSYKLKADRSLRQKESLVLERLRIDIEDLKLNAVESLQGIPYLAIGKHLCGSATDMTLRCCLGEQNNQGGVVRCSARGLAIAACCHHLCQWKHYINKSYLLNLGVSKEDFHAITWFTSWAVDANHGSDFSDGIDSSLNQQIIGKEECRGGPCRVEEILRSLRAEERAVLGFMCKDIIDLGRLMWVKEHGLETQLVKYVPSEISPENHLLIARRQNSL